MNILDEVRLIVRGIAQLKEQRDAMLSNCHEEDPYSMLEKVLDITGRYDTMVCCLILATWRLDEQRQATTITDNINYK